RIKHPAFSPAHVGFANRIKTSSLIIKETAPVAQVLKRPGRNFLGHRQRISVETATLKESNDRAGGCVRIRRIRLVMVVFRPPIRKKEVLLPIFVTALHCGVKLCSECSRVNYALEGKEYVSSVQ